MTHGPHWRVTVDSRQAGRLDGVGQSGGAAQVNEGNVILRDLGNEVLG